MSNGYPFCRSWKRILKLGVFDHVDSLSCYVELYTQGLARAHRRMFHLADPLNPNEFEIRLLHHDIFCEIHPWAGRFRRPGELAIFGGFVSADANMVEPELNILNAQTAELLLACRRDKHGRALELVEAARLIAFHHARFEAIHPFCDGNGRVGRLIVSHMEHILIGVSRPCQLPKAVYIAGLRRAHNQNDLSVLADFYMSRNTGARFLEQILEAPFPISPVREDC